jgi:uncharacterized protein (DUF1778 family)
VRAYHDVLGVIDERSAERMSFRTKPRVKETIQKAAALSEMDVSTFTMNAAYRAAMETISAHEQTTLRAIDHETLFAAIDRARRRPPISCETPLPAIKPRSPNGDQHTQRFPRAIAPPASVRHERTALSCGIEEADNSFQRPPS